MCFQGGCQAPSSDPSNLPLARSHSLFLLPTALPFKCRGTYIAYGIYHPLLKLLGHRLDLCALRLKVKAPGLVCLATVCSKQPQLQAAEALLLSHSCYYTAVCSCDLCRAASLAASCWWGVEAVLLTVWIERMLSLLNLSPAAHTSSLALQECNNYHLLKEQQYA
jgi:hypothetical protein